MAPWSELFFFRLGYDRNKSHNSKKLSCFRVPMKMFPVARKLSITKEQCQAYRFVSPERLQEQRQQLRKSFLCSSPGEVFLSSGTRRDRRTAPVPKIFVSAGRLQNQLPHNEMQSLLCRLMLSGDVSIDGGLLGCGVYSFGCRQHNYFGVT